MTRNHLKHKHFFSSPIKQCCNIPNYVKHNLNKNNIGCGERGCAIIVAVVFMIVQKAPYVTKIFNPFWSRL